MRNAELVVRYLPGPCLPLRVSGTRESSNARSTSTTRFAPPSHPPTTTGSSARCPDGHQRSFVKIALERIAGVCGRPPVTASRRSVPRPESRFHWASSRISSHRSCPAPTARAHDGLGVKPKNVRARSAGHRETLPRLRWTKRNGPTEPSLDQPGASAWMAGRESQAPASARLRPPQTRVNGEPKLNSRDRRHTRHPVPVPAPYCRERVRLSANVEVLASDGGQVEPEAPLGGARTSDPWAGSAPSGVEVRFPNESGVRMARWPMDGRCRAGRRRDGSG